MAAEEPEGLQEEVLVEGEGQELAGWRSHSDTAAMSARRYVACLIPLLALFLGVSFSCSRDMDASRQGEGCIYTAFVD